MWVYFVNTITSGHGRTRFSLCFGGVRNVRVRLSLEFFERSLFEGGFRVEFRGFFVGDVCIVVDHGGHL